MEMKVHIHFKVAHVLKLFKFIIFCAMDLLNATDSVASGVREKGYYCSVGAGAKAIRVDQGKAGEASSLA